MEFVRWMLFLLVVFFVVGGGGGGCEDGVSYEERVFVWRGLGLVRERVHESNAVYFKPTLTLTTPKASHLARMKTLLVLRHAKSSWHDPALDDHDRPLNKRGQQDGPRMGELVREHRLTPDVIISSDAVRARLRLRPWPRQLAIRARSCWTRVSISPAPPTSSRCCARCGRRKPGP